MYTINKSAEKFRAKISNFLPLLFISNISTKGKLNLMNLGPEIFRVIVYYMIFICLTLCRKQFQRTYYDIIL